MQKEFDCSFGFSQLGQFISSSNFPEAQPETIDSNTDSKTAGPYPTGAHARIRLVKGYYAVRRLCGAIGPVRRWIDSLSCLGQDRGSALAKPPTSFVYVVSGKPEIETTVESPRSVALSSEGSIL
jgi:hypothetical protein